MGWGAEAVLFSRRECDGNSRLLARTGASRAPCTFAAVFLLAHLILGPPPARAQAEAAASGGGTPPGASGQRTPLDVRIRVEGRLLADTPENQPARLGGTVLLPLRGIAERLGSQIEVNLAEKWIQLERAQDGAVFRLDPVTGEVRANGRSVGYTPGVGFPDAPGLLLPQAAVEALTGTHARFDGENDEIVVRLDDRLRTAFGFEIVVNRRPLPFADPAPRSVGSVLLLPLLPIARELATAVNFDEVHQRVAVVRSPDRANIELDLRSGVALLEGRPIGIVPNMAFARPDELLLPVDAIELLTGTNVGIEPGANIVRVDLDDRLREIQEPVAEVVEHARESGFAFEGLDFRLGNEITNHLGLRARHREFNLTGVYETPDLPRWDRLEPSFYQLGFRSMRGYGGTLGEYLAVQRELDGLGVSRIRGATLEHDTRLGRAIFLAGQPATGARQLSGGRGVTAYGGFVAGARLDGDSDDWEAGVSAGIGKDYDAGAVVASVIRRSRWEESFWKLGPATLFQEFDLGTFHGDGTRNRPDGRVSLSGRFRTGPRLSFLNQFLYEGEHFNRRVLAGSQDEGTADRLEVGSQLNWQPLHWLSTSTRTSYRKQRLLAGERDAERFTVSYGLGGTARPLDRGPSLQLDYGLTYGDSADFDPGTQHRIRAGLNQRFARTTLSLTHLFERGQTNNDSTDFSGSYVQLWTLPWGGSLSVAPSLVASTANGDQLVNSTLGIGLGSGDLLSPRVNLGLDYALSSQLLDTTGKDVEVRHFLGAVLSARLPWKLRLGVTTRTDLEESHKVFVALSGFFDFAPPRPHRQPDAGTGVLTGLVFFDQNRDGVRQKDEKELPSVPVRLRRTPLALRTNRQGTFTIQNVPAALYQLEVGLDSLPLGLLIPRSAMPVVRVDPGDLTEVEIGAIRSGQVRGRVFLDQDGDSRYGRGERDLEGVRLLVEPGGLEVYTASFGQFGLEELMPGRYEIRVDPEYLPAEAATPPVIEFEIGDEDAMVDRDIPVPVEAQPASDAAPEPR